MKKLFFPVLALLLIAGLTGCSVTPPTILETPLSARPQVHEKVANSNGAIFQSSAYRPMFEDRRARLVGDILTITITEKTSAGKDNATSGSKSGSVAASVPSLFGVPAVTTAKLGASASTGNKYEEKGATTSSNTFSGTIGVTVIEVLPNGNLIVSGEKQVGLDRGTEYIRFSGVVNPDTIIAGNTVSSTQVADARVEYRTNTHIDKAEMMGLFSRFFLSLVPL